jgi:predicted transcriptional regulator
VVVAEGTVVVAEGTVAVTAVTAVTEGAVEAEDMDIMEELVDGEVQILFIMDMMKIIIMFFQDIFLFHWVILKFS